MGTVLLCKNNVCIVFFILISVLVFVSLPQPQKTKKNYIKPPGQN